MARFRLPGLATTAYVKSAKAVAVLGGDGTVHGYLNSVAHKDKVLLPVPVGSGNDFAAALGYRTWRDAHRAWSAYTEGAENVRSVDLGVVRSLVRPDTDKHYFCCVAGAGLDSHANRIANEMRPWLRRNGGYVYAALRAIAGYQPAEMTVHAAGREMLTGPAWFAAVANAPAYGRGMRIAPDAQLDDGQLNICVVRRTSRLKLLRLFPTVFRGTHVRRAEVEYFPAARLELAAAPPQPIYGDGEYICHTPAEIWCERGALRVIVPA